MAVKPFWIFCNSCGVEFGIADGFDDVLRRSGKTFYCPNGHSMSYNGTDAAMRRERDRLKQENARLAEVAEHERRSRALAERRMSAARGQVTKLKRRASNGVCPCCNRTFVDLKRHMAGKHPGFVAEPIEGEALH